MAVMLIFPSFKSKAIRRRSKEFPLKACNQNEVTKPVDARSLLSKARDPFNWRPGEKALSLYNFIFSGIVWTILVPWQFLQILLGKSYRADLAQRLGRSNVPRSVNGKRLLILHAVSVGEVLTAEAILEPLLQDGFQLEIIITTGNHDGKKTAEQLKLRHPSVKQVLLLPWDSAGMLRPWFRRLQPHLVAVIETEIWPNLFSVCKELGIPLCIVNGRIYPKDLRACRLIKWFFRPVLSCADWIGVQSWQERRRFLQTGARPEQIEVVGNAKLDRRLPSAEVPPAWHQRLGKIGLLLVAGSTHPPEEKWLLRAAVSIRSTLPALRLIIAPRNIRRAFSVERLARHLGFRTARWSCPECADDNWDVLLLDQFGWLSGVYAYATLAVIGGSFVARGGHNFLEAASENCAILIGPHVENFQDLVE